MERMKESRPLENRLQRYFDAKFVKTDRTLDVMVHRAASHLSVQRFATCYTDKLHGNSPYEEKFNRLIRSDRLTFLPELNTHYQMLRACNLLSKGLNSDLVASSYEPQEADNRWDPAEWYKADPAEMGIDPLMDQFHLSAIIDMWSADEPGHKEDFRSKYYFCEALENSPEIQGKDHLTGECIRVSREQFETDRNSYGDDKGNDFRWT